MSTELVPRNGVAYELTAAASLDGLGETLIELGQAMDAEAVSAHREKDGSSLVCYVWGQNTERMCDAASRLQSFARGAIEATRLRGSKRLAGASWGEAPSHHYVVRTDVAPGWDEELQRWYDEEHLAGLAAVPGNVHAQRFLSLDHSPTYYACYDLVSADVLGSPAWLAVRGTAWSSRVRPQFANPRRTLFVDLLRCEITRKRS
jgi:hypothetical protein